MTKARDDTKAVLETFVKSPSLLRSLKTENFLRSGLDLIEDDQCPFCDREWDVNELRQRIEEKLAQAKTASELRREMLSSSHGLVAELLDLATVANQAVKYAKTLPEPLAMQAVGTWIETLRNNRETLASARDIEGAMGIVSSAMHEHSKKVEEEITELQTRISSLPDVSQEDEAKEFLTVAQERLDVYREARRQRDRSNRQSELSAKVLTTFSESANAVLSGIYRDVQEDFSDFYKYINREDEATFSGKLIPSFGKLGFDVEFYGRGFFPPGAYHSEGHQDSMGICLYLALMRHMLGEQFTFAVLDDILMSVDSGHRREVCSLLRSEFPQTQFIVTTHDEIWLNHLKTEQLITSKAFVQFRKWTVDDGPHVWEGAEVWQEIKNDLDNSDVPGAAQTLRRYLEYISTQLSSKLRASIEYRPDAQHDLGELLPAVVGTWNSLLSRAKDVAQSWGKKDEIAELSQRQGEFGQRVDKTNVERWPINKTIHYNEWVSLQKQDFMPVVEAFKNLLDAFRCPKCQSFVYVIPARGELEGLRCDCGSVNINLKKRPKQPPAPAEAATASV